ncbi:hypothetical protein ACFSTE_22520 [Aquimarina hainanensis]|uniref:Uncharacterized protein n=2 Tax=Aquimarina hainanensis TaxID=1578017 RepID=A0ABW5NDI9_9FLAO|nr:hypothetical protein [Aquimarina sp. TRL1]QKX07468.1 hypothetical protein HN014_21955 [Aquimarina sp. TRL1]
MKDLIPLKIGNEWIYKQTIYNKKTFKTKERIVTNKVIDSWEDENKMYIINIFDEEYFVRNTEKGLRRSNFEKKVFITRSLFLKHPNTIENTPFEYTEITEFYDMGDSFSMSEIATSKITLFSKYIDLKINNKTYTCCQYIISPITEVNNEMENYKTTIYIALGVGIVKHIKENENEIISSELTSKKL